MTKLVRPLSSSNQRGSLSSSMAADAAALRSKFGGGSSMPVRSMVRGSTGWLRNRDAIASAQEPLEHRPAMRASARFERRTSSVARLKLQIEHQERLAKFAKLKTEEEEHGDDDDDDDNAAVRPATGTAAAAAPKKTTKGAKAEKAVRPPEVDDDGLADLERLAFTTWHLSERELKAAGHDPALVRAPAVLAAVRTRFLHSPNIMLNSNFVCNFSVDQGAFKTILNRKYRLTTTYMPMTYPGMRCHFLLRRGVPLERALQPGYCDPEDRHLPAKSVAFARKYVTATFILFRTGNAFLRGSFSEEVMKFVYRQFKRILVDEYPNICTRYTCPDAKDSHSVVKTRTVFFSTVTAAASSSVSAGGVKQEEEEAEEDEKEEED